MKKIFAIAMSVGILCGASAEPVRPGQFIEVFASAKMGGPNYHAELKSELAADRVLKGLEIVCIKGLNRSASSTSSAASVDREREHPPVPAAVCKGSAAILIGPIRPDVLDGLKQHIDNDYAQVILSIRTVR